MPTKVTNSLHVAKGVLKTHLPWSISRIQCRWSLPPPWNTLQTWLNILQWSDQGLSNSEIQLLTSASREVLIQWSAMPSSPDNTISRHSSGWCLLNVTPYHVLNGNNHLERRHQEGIISNLKRAQHTKKSDLSSARENDLLPQQYENQEGGFLPLRNTTPWKGSLSGDFNSQPSCTQFSLDTQSTRCVFKEQSSTREGKLS